MRIHFPVLLSLFFILLSPCSYTFGQERSLGILEQAGDIGNVPRTGSVHYDSASGTYRINGNGGWRNPQG